MKRSLLEGIPTELPQEFVEILAQSADVKIERIVSRGHASASGFWYDQDADELVVLIAGRAGLRFEGDDEVVVMEAGDWMEIRAHTRHRVEWTAPGRETIWLAVHY